MSDNPSCGCSDRLKSLRYGVRFCPLSLSHKLCRNMKGYGGHIIYIANRQINTEVKRKELDFSINGIIVGILNTIEN